MSAPDIRSESRRQFLKFLSGSPLLAYSGLGTGAADGPTTPPRLSDPILWAPLRTEDLIKSPAEAINVFDFEPVARKTVPAGAFRLHGLGHRRRGDPARQSRGLPEVPAAPAPPQRRLQGRPGLRALRQPMEHADRHCADGRQQVLPS